MSGGAKPEQQEPVTASEVCWWIAQLFSAAQKAGHEGFDFRHTDGADNYSLEWGDGWAARSQVWAVNHGCTFLEYSRGEGQTVAVLVEQMASGGPASWLEGAEWQSVALRALENLSRELGVETVAEQRARGKREMAERKARSERLLKIAKEGLAE